MTLLMPPSSSALPSLSKCTFPVTCFLALQIILHFLEFYIYGFIQFVFFLDWLLSLSITVLRVIHVACISASFFILWNIIPLYGLNATVFLFIHSRWAFELFSFGAITNKVAKNIIGKFLCGHRLSLSQNKYLEVEWLDHIVDTCLKF